MLIRFFIYGIIGWAAEIFWTGLPKRRPIDWTLQGYTQWWTLPIYGQLATLYEPLHNRIRHLPFYVRGLLYAVGFIAVEFTAGEIIKKVIGKIPWDYTGKTRWQFRGTTRFDYAIIWFGFGLMLEPVHDYLVRITPYLLKDFGGGVDREM